MILTDCMLLHVTYAFQSESKLYSCLNVKESFLEPGAIKFKWKQRDSNAHPHPTTHKNY